MKKLIFLIASFFIVSLIFASSGLSEELSGCKVNEVFDREDSSGYHYDVYDSNNNNIGYITQSKENENIWYIWIKDEGDPNSQFETKIEALEELCKYSSEKIE